MKRNTIKLAVAVMALSMAFSACDKDEGSGNNNGSGNGTTGGNGDIETGCNWNSAVASLGIKVERGTRCGDPNSVEITITNNYSENVNIYVYMFRTDGNWYGEPDGTFGNGLASGKSTTWYICSGTGDYRVFGMRNSDYIKYKCIKPEQFW